MRGKIKFFPCACCGNPVPIEKATEPKYIFCKASCHRKLWRTYKNEQRMEEEDQWMFDERIRGFYLKITDAHRTPQLRKGRVRLSKYTQEVSNGAELCWDDFMPSVWEKYFREIDSARAESNGLVIKADNIVQCAG